MSTTITSENDVEIRVGKLGVGVVHPEGVASIWARLSDAQRVQLAAALDPGRTPTGGQWTRNDLPRIGAAEVAHDPVVDGVLDTVVHWLNKHYPKPERSAMDYAEIIAFEAARATRTERERDESLRVKGEAFDRAVRAERERDAAVARAEQAENARDTAATRAKQLEREVSKVEGRASEWSIKAQEWQDRAEAAEARTAVTREDVEKVVHGSGGGFFDSRLDAITDAVCDLFGVEAEQPVDPVEDKARELYRAATPDARWETVADEYRRIAAHILGQEADQ